jgi:hypothetical protein
MLPSLTDITLFASVAAVGSLAVPPRARPWILTAVFAPILATAGTLEAVYWLVTRDTLSGPDTIVLLEFIKAYLFVDLCFSAALDIRRVPLLTGWIQRIAYFYVADHLLATHQDGLVRPFLIAELSTTILAWGHIIPAWRADRLVGATFLVTRIILPLLFATQMRLTDFLWSVFGIAITVHLFWFGRWVAKQRI